MNNNYSKADFWTKKAAKEGYPARSVYKLQEIDAKFKLFPPSPRPPFSVLDLGAAPGSWSLFILKKYAPALKNAPLLTSCDLKPLSDGQCAPLFAEFQQKGNFFFVQGDFMSAETQPALLKYAPFNLILSDAAPSTSGNKNLDGIRSIQLADFIADFAEIHLKTGGKLVIKVFQGAEIASFLQKTRSLFGPGTSVKTFKPSVCRASSVETYVIAEKCR